MVIACQIVQRGQQLPLGGCGRPCCSFRGRPHHQQLTHLQQSQLYCSGSAHYLDSQQADCSPLPQAIS